MRVLAFFGRASNDQLRITTDWKLAKVEDTCQLEKLVVVRSVAALHIMTGSPAMQCGLNVPPLSKGRSASDPTLNIPGHPCNFYRQAFRRHWETADCSKAQRGALSLGSPTNLRDIVRSQLRVAGQGNLGLSALGLSLSRLQAAGGYVGGPRFSDILTS